PASASGSGAMPLRASGRDSRRARRAPVPCTAPRLRRPRAWRRPQASGASIAVERASALALERCAVPVPEFGRRLVRALEELEEYLVWRGRLPHLVVGQH